MADARIANLRDCTTVDGHTGAMRSVQTADVLLSERALSELWSPENLERLARTYWRFLTRVTLGLVRVRYTERERLVVLLCRPLKLLTFSAPEYELEPDHGVVRWRIVRGLLVARGGTRRQGAPADRRAPLPDADPGARRACTSRSRSPTSTRRSPRASAAASTTRPSRAST